MRGALAQEWMRLRTVRSTWWLSGSALAVAVLVTGGGLWLLSLARAQPEFGVVPVDQSVYLGMLSFWTFPVSLLLALLAVLSFGHEYRYGTMRATLTTVPSRAAVGAAKVVVTAGWTVAVMLTALLLSWAMLSLFGSFSSDTGLTQGDGPRTALGMVLYALLLSLLGLGLGWLLRSQLVAVIVLLLWALAAEGAVTTLFVAVAQLQPYAWLTNYLPLSAGRRMYAPELGADFIFGAPLSPLAGGLLMTAVVAAVLTAAYLLFEKRDA